MAVSLPNASLALLLSALIALCKNAAVGLLFIFETASIRIGQAKATWLRLIRFGSPRMTLLVVGLAIILLSFVIFIIAANAKSLFRTEPLIPAVYQKQVVYPITNETMYVRITLSSETFGAQTPITAEAFLFPDHIWRNTENIGYGDLDGKVFSVFVDGTGCPDVTDSVFYGETSQCVIPMEQVNERSSTYPNGVINFKGGKEIKFAQGGTYDVAVTDFRTFSITVPNMIQIEPISTTLDNTYFLAAIITNIIGIIVTIVASVLRERK